MLTISITEGFIVDDSKLTDKEREELIERIHDNNISIEEIGRITNSDMILSQTSYEADVFVSEELNQ